MKRTIWLMVIAVLAFTTVAGFAYGAPKSQRGGETTCTIAGLVSSVDFGAGTTTVRFKDGRVKVFNNVTNEVLQVYRWHVITFDSKHRIISVRIEDIPQTPMR